MNAVATKSNCKITFTQKAMKKKQTTKRNKTNKHRTENTYRKKSGVDEEWTINRALHRFDWIYLLCIYHFVCVFFLSIFLLLLLPFIYYVYVYGKTKSRARASNIFFDKHFLVQMCTYIMHFNSSSSSKKNY